MTKNDEVVERLAPCPFCGDKAWSSGYAVQCDSCGARSIKPERGAAIEAWNKRPTLQAGASLGNGLWAAPEEPTNLMLMKATQTLLTPDIGVRKCRRVYEAMRRAAGGGDE